LPDFCQIVTENELTLGCFLSVTNQFILSEIMGQKEKNIGFLSMCSLFWSILATCKKKYNSRIKENMVFHCDYIFCRYVKILEKMIEEYIFISNDCPELVSGFL